MNNAKSSPSNNPSGIYKRIKKPNLKISPELTEKFSSGRKVALKPFQKFLLFIENKAILSLAIGVIIGDTIKQLVNTLVDGVIRPFIGLFLPTSSEFAPLNIPVGNVVFKLGDLLSVLLQSFIIFFILYVFLSWLLKKEDMLGVSDQNAEKIKKSGK